jgi:predicted ATPase/class 3 adenylate cyclase
VTFLFTDIEGSTRLWDEHAEAMRQALARHDSILRASIDGHDGLVFSTGGDGVAAAFQRAGDAVSAAISAQRGLSAEPWPVGLQLKVRMGLHTGEAQERDGDYFGTPVNRTARLMAVGHGGQILVSGTTAELLDDRALRSQLRDLGQHRLRDLQEAQQIYQVWADGLDATFPALRSLDAYVHNLPPQRTEFVGRAGELETLTRLVSTRRLVTLTAVGGAGKTRMALEVGATLIGNPFTAVHFVDLSAVDDPGEVATAVETKVGMPPGFGLSAYLSGRHELLILDNCEHLLDGCADLVDELLVECPKMSVLATSREALQVDGEQLMPLGPLSAEHDGVELFVTRARLLEPDYAPDAPQRTVITEICRRLDGLPLAIEMAAGRVREMSPEEILRRLDDRFSLLSGGRRRIGRQRTLEATIDWSYDLLAEPAKAMLQQMSVFVAPATSDDIVAVCSGGTASTTSVRTHFDALVNANLVVVIPGAEVTGYSLLETIRFYAHNKLVESGDHRATQDRHMAHYIGQNATMAGGSYKKQFAWSLRNMISAVDHGLDTGNDAGAVEAYSFFGGLMEAGSESGERRRARVHEAAERAGGVLPLVIDFVDIEFSAFSGRFDDVMAQTERYLGRYSQSDMSTWTHYQIYPFVLSWMAWAISSDDPGRAESLCDEVDRLASEYYVELNTVVVRSFIAVARGDLGRAYLHLTGAEAGVHPTLVPIVMAVHHLLGRTDEAAALLPMMPERGGMYGPDAHAVAAIACEWSAAPVDALRRLEISLRSARSPYHRRSALIGLAAVLAHRADAERAWLFMAASTRLPGLRLPIEVALMNHHLPLIEAQLDQSRLAELQAVADRAEISTVLADAIRLVAGRP